MGYLVGALFVLRALTPSVISEKGPLDVPYLSVSRAQTGLDQSSARMCVALLKTKAPIH